MANSFLGIVLAGGLSTRMGTNKALLPYQGKRLIDHMIELVRDALSDTGVGPAQVHISGKIPNYPGIPNVPSVHDQIKGIGPIGGIATVLNQVRMTPVTHLIFVPVDMPALTPALLKSLACTDLSANALYYEDSMFPLRLRNTPIVHRTLQNMIRESLERSPSAPSSACSVRDLHQRLGGRKLMVSPELRDQLVNLNTPEEWIRHQANTRSIA